MAQTDKHAAQYSPKHTISSQKFVIFFWEGLAPPQIHPLMDLLLPSNQAFRIRLCDPHKSTQITI